MCVSKLYYSNHRESYIKICNTNKLCLHTDKIIYEYSYGSKIKKKNK